MASSIGIPDPAISGSLQLEGLAGSIEAVLDLPAGSWQDTPRAIALCCHPHPLFGGSLTNKVIHSAARSCVAAGAAALRFNFRGVGQSAGQHDQGRGEALDVLHLSRQLRARWPDTPLWLAGFSFGAWISLKVAHELGPQRLITIAPPVGRWDFSDISPPECPWLLVQGGRDELVDPGAVQQWARGFGDRVTYAALPAADHFFHGQLLELRAVIEEFFGEETAPEAPRKM